MGARGSPRPAVMNCRAIATGSSVSMLKGSDPPFSRGRCSAIRMDDALDGIEATYGAHVLIAQTRDRVLVVRERVAGLVEALFVAGGATGQQ